MDFSCSAPFFQYFSVPLDYLSVPVSVSHFLCLEPGGGGSWSVVWEQEELPPPPPPNSLSQPKALRFGGEIESPLLRVSVTLLPLPFPKDLLTAWCRGPGPPCSPPPCALGHAVQQGLQLAHWPGELHWVSLQRQDRKPDFPGHRPGLGPQLPLLARSSHGAASMGPPVSRRAAKNGKIPGLLENV